MATVVQIELMVDEKGAVSGVRAFDTAIKGTSGSVRQLGTQLDAVGTRATAAGKKTKIALEQTGVSALSSVEKTRLLTEEFGVHLPRAMVRLAAESKVVSGVIGAIGPALVGLGAIQIGALVFTQLIDGAQKLWHNWLNVNAAIEDYNAEVAKTKQQDFGNTRSIETTRVRIAQATAEVQAYRAAADALDQKYNHSILHALDPAALYTTWQAHELNNTAMESQRQLDRLKNEKEPEQRHQGNIDQIELQHAGDGRLRGEQKITAELEKQLQLLQEGARAEAEQEGKLGNPVGNSSLWNTGKLSKPQIDQMKAYADADAQRFNLRREQEQEMMNLRHAATEASMRGEALYHQQELDAIEQLQFKDIDRAKATDYIQQKFHNEQIKRLEDEGRETQKLQLEAAMTGWTGIAKIGGQGDIDIGDVRGNQDLPDEEKDKRVAAIKQRTNAEIIQSEQQFTDRVNSLVDERAAHQVSGFARIRSEAQKQSSAFEKDYQKQYGTNVNAPEYQAHIGELNRGETAIAGSAQDQTAELAKRNADETAQIESEAHVRSLNAEKQRTAAIESEYHARTAKYQEELAAKEISENDFSRRMAAAAQERDADMVQAAREAREKMAAEFDSFFKGLDHPTQALKNLGDKVAGEAAAALMQKIQQRGQGAGATPAAPEGGIVGILTGGFGGLFGKRSKTPGATQDAKAELPHVPGVSAAHDKVFTVAQATIHVGSATFGGFGGGGFAGGGGGTSLLAPSATSFRPTYTGESSPAWSGSGTTTSTAPALSVNGAAVPTGGMMGGAGDASSAPAVSNFNAGSGAAPAPGQNKVGGILGDLKQGMGLVKQGAGIFGGGGGKSGAASQDQYAETQDATVDGQFDKDGNFAQKGSGTGGMLGGGGIAANAGGAIGGALGLYSAYEGNGGVGGAASGAMSGMELGMSLGGPIGAAVGAVGGAILGAIGFGGREKARVYDLKQIRPRLSNDIDGFQQGSMDYTSAYSDIEGLSREANMTTNAMGPAGKSYYQDTIKKEIKDAEGKLTAEQRAGRSMYTTTAAQFATGIDSVPRDGMAMLHQKEMVFSAPRTERATRALENGASLESVHRSYQAAMSTRDARRAPSGGERTMNMNVHAIDAKGVAQFFDKYKHHMRRALNSSYAENSGGADA
jgi:hypothetical protein